MPTFKPVVYKHQQRNDGSYNVKIRITHNRKSRHLPTSLTVRQSDLTRNTLRIKSVAIVDKATDLIREMQEICGELNTYALADMDVSEVVDYISARIRDKHDKSTVGFLEYGLKFAETKTPGTRTSYASAVRSFGRFLQTMGMSDIDAEKISVPLLRRYVEYVNEGKKRKWLTAKEYIGKLGTIYRTVKLDLNDEEHGIIRLPGDPFARMTFPATVNEGARAMSIEEIQLIIDECRSVRSPQVGRALRCFLVSFALAGMNMADMYECGFPEGGMLVYNRRKVRDRRADRAEQRIRMSPVIEKVCGLLPPSKNTFFGLDDEFTSRNCATYGVNKALHVWAKDVGIPDFTLYSARHSWATIAASSRCGIPVGIVDDALVHLGAKLTRTYVEKDWENVWNACDKVLSLFDWSPLDRKGTENMK